MDFAFSAEQEELKKSARRFLATQSSPARVRAAMATDDGYERDVWHRIAQELGWPALTIPEEYGGAGFSYVEQVAVMEEMGRALLCSPYFASVCLAANAILSAASDAQKRELLPGIAAGETTATLALTEESGTWDAAGIQATARREGESFVLDGVKTFVLDGHTAALLVVAARTPGSTGRDGVSLFAFPARTPGVTRQMLPTMDATRRQATITLADVRVPASARLAGQLTESVPDKEAWRAIETTIDLACVALAAEQLGGAERCLEMAVEYAKVRTQFGRPIGSFQAIKHMCADMMVQVESARSASYYAGWAASAAVEELPTAAPAAKAFCSDAYFHCSGENIQIHGGIGFTWEHDAHLYFKRAKSSETLLGNATHHREVLARRIGL